MYRFSHPQALTVHDEYLIYDDIGLIGSVGGTLGMFIGFSFSGIITCFFNFLKQFKWIVKTKFKNKKDMPSNESSNIVVVKPAFDASQVSLQILTNVEQSKPEICNCHGNYLEHKQKFDHQQEIIENILARLYMLEHQRKQNKTKKYLS